MAEHTPTPWMTNRAGELLPDDWMIVADMGKTPNGIQQISTVARALSIRQTPEVTAANAAFIVRAVNSHAPLVKALERLLRFCDEATPYEAEHPSAYSPYLDAHAALAAAKGEA